MELDVPNNFLGLPADRSTYETSRFVVQSIPYDGSVSWQKGAARGPRAIIEASKQVEFYDIETNREPSADGIFTATSVPCRTGNEMRAEGYARTLAAINDGKFVITLGGDHSISYGPIKAYAEKFPALSILHIDAHGDRRAELNGDPYSHGSVMARAMEMVHGVTSVGIRAIDKSELDTVSLTSPMFFAEKLQDNPRWIDDVVRSLGPRVYISIDVDAFDPSLMPSTGTPVPGGLRWYDTLALLRRTFDERTVVGADVVELLPGPNPSSDFVAAKLVHTLVAYEVAARAK